MISKKMQNALNEQINEELFSSYLYLQMSAWFQSENLTGMARWMAAQSKEETAHAMKLFEYILDRGGEVALKEIAAPQAKWKNPLDAFKAAYKHEQHITACFTETLVPLARQEKDTATEIFLQWYVTEQVEEEANADSIVQKLTAIGEAAAGLFMLDAQLGARGGD